MLSAWGAYIELSREEEDALSRESPEFQRLAVEFDAALRGAGRRRPRTDARSQRRTGRGRSPRAGAPSRLCMSVASVERRMNHCPVSCRYTATSTFPSPS